MELWKDSFKKNINKFIITGEPGVGKISIFEGLA